MSINLLTEVPGTDLGVKVVLIEKGRGVPQRGIAKLAVKSPVEFVDLSRLKRLGSFEHNYRSWILPEQAIQKVIDDLEGKGPVTHVVYRGHESEQVQDSVGVTFYFTGYSGN